MSLVGVAMGIGVVATIGQWAKLPTEVHRGYANAFAIGLLIVAAITLIPTAFSEMTFVMSELFLRYAFFLTRYERIPWSIIVPALTQALGIIGIFKAYLEGNGVGYANEVEMAVTAGKLTPRRVGWHTRLALLDGAQTDRVGIFIILLGLICYCFLQGAQASARTNADLSSVLVISLTVLLSTAVIAHIPRNPVRTQLLLLAATGLGLAWLLGLVGASVVFAFSTVLITVGTVALVFSIGRTLRLVEYQIGLGWQTTAVVIATTAVFYGWLFLLR